MKKTLYKITNTGKTQFWQIEVENGAFRTTTGQVGGAEIQSKWTICKTKNVGQSNATSVQEQALKEAESKITKKMEKGYSEDIKKAGRPKFFEPMLAKEWSKRKDKVKFPVWSQPKLDGIRCVITKDGMFSRNGKRFVSCPHIFEAVKNVFVKNPNFVFDGELYNHRYSEDFNEISSLVKKQKPTPEDISITEKCIQYHVYDCYNADRATFIKRFEKLLGELFTLKLAPFSTVKECVEVVKTIIVNNEIELDNLYAEYAKLGFEGQMIRIDAPYENKRSAYLLKRKEFMTEEFKILDIEEGSGNKTGMAASVLFERNGKKFNSNVKGSFKFVTQMWKDRKSLIGEMATVRFQNYTPDGIPRFPYVIAIRDYE